MEHLYGGKGELMSLEENSSKLARGIMRSKIRSR